MLDVSVIEVTSVGSVSSVVVDATGALRYAVAAEDSAADAAQSALDAAALAAAIAESLLLSTIPDADIPAAQQVIRTAGNAAVADGGHGIYSRVSTPSPVQAWHVQSADGAYWQLDDTELRDTHFIHLATDVGGAAEDWCAALNTLYEAMEALGRPGRITGVRECRGVIETRSGTELRFSPGAQLKQVDFSVIGAFVTNVVISSNVNDREQARVSLIDACVDGTDYPLPEYYALSSVGTTTMVLPAGASSVDDYYTGAIVQIVTGSGRALWKFITDYVGSTRTLSVATAWGTAPTAGDTIAIGYNDNAVGFAWGSSNIVIRGGILSGYEMHTQVPFGSGGKGINFEQGVYGGSITGVKFYNQTTALYLSGRVYTLSNGSAATVVGTTVSDLYAENCGALLTLANLDAVDGITQSGSENNWTVSNLTFKNCGHAPYRIVGTGQQKSGIINLMGTNGSTVSNVRGWNESGYPASYPTDYSTRCGYGLTGPIGAVLWGHARNSSFRDIDYTGDADSAVHIGRVRALGDDAGTSGTVSQCYDWNIYNLRVHGAVTRVVNTDPDLPIAANEVIGYWQIGVDSASTALLSTALSATTTLVLDLTENLTGKRVIGTAAAIIAAGNTFASFPTGTTDLRGKTTSLEKNVLTLTLADDIASYVTLPTGAGGKPDCRIHVHSNSATGANGLLSTYGGTLMVTSQTSTTFEKSTGALSNADGTDGKITLSVSSGRLYVSNRVGATVAFRFYVDPCL